MVLKVILYIFLFEHFLRFGMMMLNCKYFLVNTKTKATKVVLCGGGEKRLCCWAVVLCCCSLILFNKIADKFSFVLLSLTFGILILAGNGFMFHSAPFCGFWGERIGSVCFRGGLEFETCGIYSQEDTIPLNKLKRVNIGKNV